MKGIWLGMHQNDLDVRGYHRCSILFSEHGKVGLMGTRRSAAGGGLVRPTRSLTDSSRLNMYGARGEAETVPTITLEHSHHCMDADYMTDYDYIIVGAGTAGCVLA